MSTPEINQPTSQFAAEKETTQSEQDQKMKRIMIGVIVGAVVLLILLGVAIFFLLQPGTPTDRIR